MMRPPRGILIDLLILLSLALTAAACGGAPMPTPAREAVPPGTRSPATPTTPATATTAPATPAPSLTMPTATRLPSPSPPDRPTGKLPPPTGSTSGPTATIVARLQPLPADESRPRAIAFADPARGWLAAERTILSTNDGGQHWARQFVGPGLVTALDALPSGQVWAATAAGLVGSDDGGRTWRPVAAERLPSVGAVDFVAPDHGWVTTSPRNDLLRTTDGGQTWVAVPTPCARLGGGGIFSFLRPNTGWALCTYNGAGAVQTKPSSRPRMMGRTGRW